MLAHLPLPLFSFVDLQGQAILLRFDSDLFLPLFTCLENATLYAERGSLLVNAVVLDDATSTAEFICAVDDEPFEGDPFRIVMDPIAPDVGEFWVVEKAELVKYLICG